MFKKTRSPRNAFLVAIGSLGAVAMASLAMTGVASAFPNYPPPTTTTTVAPVTAPAAPLTPGTGNPTAATAAFDQIVVGNALYASCVPESTLRFDGVLSQERYVGAAPAGVIVDGNWLPSAVAAGYDGNYGCPSNWPAY
jgi:hypothetical protein